MCIYVFFIILNDKFDTRYYRVTMLRERPSTLRP